MGCDIHAMMEKKDTKYGYWLNAGDPDIGRCYRLFSMLAGVRGCGDPIVAEPRGVPEDATAEFIAWHNSWDVDAHTASWVTLPELITFRIEHLQLIDDMFEELGLENPYDILVETMIDVNANPEDVRLLFFFDS